MAKTTLKTFLRDIRAKANYPTPAELVQNLRTSSLEDIRRRIEELYNSPELDTESYELVCFLFQPPPPKT